MQIDLLAAHVKSVRRGPRGIQPRNRAGLRRIGEKVDVQRFPVRSGLKKRILADGLEQLLRRPDNHGNSIAVALFYLRLDGVPDARRAHWSFENHVAALDERAYVDATGVQKHLGELLHRQRVLAADVDATEQSEVGHLFPHACWSEGASLMLYSFS